MSRVISKCPKCGAIDTLRFKRYNGSGFIYECIRSTCKWEGYLEEIKYSLRKKFKHNTK